MARLHFDRLLALARPSDLRRRLIELPTERAIAVGRMILAITCDAAVAINPPPTETARTTIAVVLLLYSLLSVALMVLPILPVRRWFLYGQHAVDIGVTWSMIFFTDVSTSPYFTLFVFSLVAGLLRWNWRGALTTAAILAGLLLLLPSEFLQTPSGLQIMDADLSRVVVRGGFLLVCGALLAYLGAHRERSRRRFAQLAAWPASGGSEEGTDILARCLAHAAMVLQAPRVLLVWEEEDEPVLNSLLWVDGAVSQAREAPDAFGELFDAGEEVSFCGPAQSPRAQGSIERYRLDSRLERTFALRTAATAPFKSELCTGRVFMLDRPSWIEEDVPVVQMIAQRLGVEIEDSILRRRLQEGARLRERVRLGRDLHDGVLQGLAAANMQLKVLSAQLPGDLERSAAAIREMLAGESQRIRRFVEESRVMPLREPEKVSARRELDHRAARLRSQWGCGVAVSVEPADLELRFPTSRHLGYLVDEGVSNAVRHGRASNVALALSRCHDGLRLRIRDDGCGFTQSREAGLDAVPPERPRSLWSRVEEIGGTLAIASSIGGVDIQIELPT